MHFLSHLLISSHAVQMNQSQRVLPKPPSPLHLNLEEQDPAVWFRISQPTASRYLLIFSTDTSQKLIGGHYKRDSQPVQFHLKRSISTGACHHWCDISFIETPSDLFLQSSTWWNYKSNNTFKFLVACTPNGCICFISEGYVGSISDINFELTNVSGFLERTAKCPGTAVIGWQRVYNQWHAEISIALFLAVDSFSLFSNQGFTFRLQVFTSCFRQSIWAGCHCP